MMSNAGAEGGNDDTFEVIGVLGGDGFVGEGALEGVGGFGSDGEVRGDGGQREVDVGSAGGLGALRACRLASAEDGQRRTELRLEGFDRSNVARLAGKAHAEDEVTDGDSGQLGGRTSKLSRVRPSRRAISRT